MSRLLRKQLFSTLDLMDKANKELERNLLRKHFQEQNLVKLLSDCQESALEMGNLIEKLYGENTRSVRELEEYCETLYQTSQAFYNPLGRRECLNQLGKHIKRLRRIMGEEVPDRFEAVFLPYKISMWDSLESVWQAAAADPDCDAYVIPIPYYDRNPDGSFKDMHYEGEQYPTEVPVTYYEDYDFEAHMPDAVFIHNPYDNYNYVTSVHPYFYSSNLKGLTNLLVYIPYFSTAGGMSEAQSKCIAYYYADYIMIQSEKFRKFYDPALPQEKLRPLGSPKFDRIVRICENPPDPPAEWKEKMAGKKVYFYNTSLNGMLGNTPGFLKKMKYVFDCFEGREDACLLWRPHPLMESTFESVRGNYKPIYDELKKYFLDQDLGIYDDTPEITSTIALCDAYIGDSGTSVTSLFGIVGKPMFILNNSIHSRPKENDWRGEITNGFALAPGGAWMITQGNKLYRGTMEEDSIKFQHCCDLSNYARGAYYSVVRYINGAHYVCPANAQDIIILDEDGQVKKRIPLDNPIEQGGAFYASLICEDRYLFLIPRNYPAIVRYDTFSGELSYLPDNLDVFISTERGEQQVGGVVAWKEYLYLASPVDNRVLRIHGETGAEEIITVEANDSGDRLDCSGIGSAACANASSGKSPDSGSCGCAGMGIDLEKEEIWLLPYEGMAVRRWNLNTGQVREYRNWPEGFTCFHPVREYMCEGLPFASILFDPDTDYVYFTPSWGNMYIRLDKNSGEAASWNPPFPLPKEPVSGYYGKWSRSYFIIKIKDFSEPFNLEGAKYWLFSLYDKRLYQFDLHSDEYREISIDFDLDEVKANEPGFKEDSQWLMYVCQENALNSLTDFLDGRISGNEFDMDRQIQAFSQIAVNPGMSGERIYQFIKSKA